MQTITQQIQEELIRRGNTLSVAESCTSGRLAMAFTQNSGASAFFEGGLVAYQNRVKERLLGVPSALIDTYDVVSREVAEAMVRGSIAMFHTDFAIATTGYAGPSGGTDTIPVGTIWIACGNRTHQVSLCLQGDLGREANVERATQEAIRLFAQFIGL